MSQRYLSVYHNSQFYNLQLVMKDMQGLPHMQQKFKLPLHQIHEYGGRSICMQGLNADEAEQGIGALDEEMLQRPVIDQLWNIKAWFLAYTPSSYALILEQQTLCRCYVHCITGMTTCALLYWRGPLCMYIIDNGQQNVKHGCCTLSNHVYSPCR